MKEQEKQILLQDLCARLPHKLHCRVFRLNGDIKENDDILYGVIGDNVVTLKSDKDECLMYYQIKPYLRPMSSMTEEEKKEFIHYASYEIEELVNGRHYEYYLMDSVGTPEEPTCNPDAIDWLNAHYFDHRGLIEMGLALEAPEGMYETKTV